MAPVLRDWEKDPGKRPAAKLIEEAKTLLKRDHHGGWGKAALERLKQIQVLKREEIHDIIGYDE